MNPIPTDLFDRAATALFPIVTDENSPAIPGPARNAEGWLNLLAWNQILSLLLWFGYDALSLHAELLASTLAENPDFPSGYLTVSSIELTFLEMSQAITDGVPIGPWVSAIDSLRTAIEAMAVVLSDYGEPVDPQVLSRMRGVLKDLDEQINTRIEGEKL